MYSNEFSHLGLVRLDYRVNEWDPHVRRYLQALSARKPVIFAGDMNVGHLDVDIHNPTAKHISKQAGLTPRERESFSQLLATPSSSHHSDTFVDAFRFFHPDAKGQFTYWSQRVSFSCLTYYHANCICVYRN